MVFLISLYQLMESSVTFFSFNSVMSTNDKALKRISDGLAVEGDVICTGFQEQGRGQGGNSWESLPEKNLLCSLILSPRHLHPSQQFILTQVVSLGILEAIQMILPNELCHIKWPNDLYIHNKKVGGILFQNIIKGNEIDFAVAGIGINVNQEQFNSRLPNPIAIKHYLKDELSIMHFREQLFKSIFRKYRLSYSQMGIELIQNEYLSKLYRINQWQKYLIGNLEITGMIVGVDEFGRLAFKNEEGQQSWYQFKEIEFVF